jgi:hypothetical protein
MKILSTAALALLVLVLSTDRGHGQDAVRVGLGTVGGYYTLEGDDFEEVGAGFGVEGVLRLSLFERLQLGGGVHWSRHRLDFLDTDLSVLVIFAEPRLSFARESPRVAPFLAGRVGYALQSAELRAQGTRIEVDAAGYLLGAVAGLEFPLTRNFALEGSASYYWLSFGEAEVSGLPIRLPESSGHALGIRAGLSFYF